MHAEREIAYLKPPGPPQARASSEIRVRVERMLADIESGGLDAVRRWSAELDGWEPEAMANLLAAYWQAVVDVCAQAWSDEVEYPYLHNTKGIYILHAFFPAAFAHSAKLRGGPTRENFATVLRAAGVDDEFFKSGGELEAIGGWGGFKTKAQELVSNLAA